MRFTVVAVGKLKERFWTDACAEYLKRLQPYAKTEVREIADVDPGRAGGVDAARDREGAAIVGALSPSSHVVLLAIDGKQRSSEGFSQRIDALKLIAAEFHVPIEKLLDMPLQAVCQSCGMPLSDPSLLGTEADGSPSEHHCKWCYANGDYLGACTMEDMVGICVANMTGPDAPFTEDEARAYMEALLPTLDRWKGAASD